MSHTFTHPNTNSNSLDFQSLVDAFYEPLHRFALRLSRNPDHASDLTQQTFYRALSRQNQLRHHDRAKSWLFTILYREFLGLRRHAQKFPTQPLDAADHPQHVTAPRAQDTLDSNTAVEALNELDEHHRLPLVLFYQKDYSYRQIAESLQIPVGTVMSRLNRAKQLLRHKLESNPDSSKSHAAGRSSNKRVQTAGVATANQDECLAICE